MPVHMRRPGRLTERAIESVLAQTFEDFEFIIVDDGSIDGLWQELQEYQKKDPRIVLVRHEANSGLPSARINEGLLIAKGKYVGYMFEDDEWSPNALELLMATMSKMTMECLVYGIVEWRDSSQGSISDVTDKNACNAAKVREYQTLGEWDFSFAELMADNKIANCGVLHPFSMLEECGFYDPHVLLRRLSDYDLWIRLARKFPFIRRNDVVARASSSLKHSLGRTVHHDPILTRRYMAQGRDSQLQPQRIHDFELDSLSFVGDPEEKYRIRENHMIPFWSQRADVLMPGAAKLALTNKPSVNKLLITKHDYSAEVDVTLGNYQQILSNSIQSSVFIPERYLVNVRNDQFDTLILHRTIAEPSLLKANQASRDGKNVIYLMDDNLFKLGTGYLEDAFSYLKPDSVGYDILEREVKNADLVLSYSPQITADSSKLNPRTIELSTNIRDAYVRNARTIRGGHKTGRRLKYAIITSPSRSREIRVLWEVLENFSKLHKDSVEFHFWGFDSSELGELDCPTFYRPFDHSYASYLKALQRERFDFLVCPLFDDHDAMKSKSPVKYLEATAAGAVGIFSDATVYQSAKAGQTCLKVAVEPEGWPDVLEASFKLSDGQRQLLFKHARTHVLERFTSESQVLVYLSALEAAELHSRLRSRSSDNGRAAIAYFFSDPHLGGATLHLLQQALTAKGYMFRPVLCFPANSVIGDSIHEFAEIHNLEIAKCDYLPTVWRRALTSEDETRVHDLAEWFKENDIRLVHLVTFSADAIAAANSLELPVINSLHAHYAPPRSNSDLGESLPANPKVSVVHSSSLRYARRWEEELDSPAFCIRAPVEPEYFESFEMHLSRSLSDRPTLIIPGTIQPRKGQLEAIEAAGILHQQGIEVQLILLGYDHLVPSYVEECKRRIRELSLGEMILLPGFIPKPIDLYSQADFVLCASTDESMPQSLLQAMAAGIRVITTPVGGVEELIQDGFSGIVAEGTTAVDIAKSIARALEIPHNHWQAMLQKAQDRASMVCEREVVAYQLLRLYNYGAARSVRPGVGRSRRGNKIGNGDGNELKLSEPLQLAEPSSSPGLVSNPTVARRITSRGLTYIIKVERNGWNGLRILLATYGENLSGTLDVRINHAAAPDSALREINIDLEPVKDNAQYLIEFPPITNSLNHEFLVTFEPKFDHPSMRLAVYELGDAPGLPSRIFRRLSTGGGVLHGQATFVGSSNSRDG